MYKLSESRNKYHKLGSSSDDDLTPIQKLPPRNPPKETDGEREKKRKRSRSRSSSKKKSKKSKKEKKKDEKKKTEKTEHEDSNTFPEPGSDFIMSSLPPRSQK